MKRRDLFKVLGAASVAPVALAVPTKKFPDEIRFQDRSNHHIRSGPLVLWCGSSITLIRDADTVYAYLHRRMKSYYEKDICEASAWINERLKDYEFTEGILELRIYAPYKSEEYLMFDLPKYPLRARKSIKHQLK